MVTRDQLKDLLARVRAATGSDRELDADIARLLLGKEVKREVGRRSWRMGHKKTLTRAAEPWIALPNFTGSIDASLIPSGLLLQGWMWSAGNVGPKDTHWACLTELKGDCRDFDGSGPSDPFAILAATLSALIQENDNA